MVRTVFLRRALPYASVFALTLAIFLTAFYDRQGSSSVVRGDFPAFYSAAEIVKTGQNDKLYDIELHRQIQNKHWPSLEGAALMFSYPAYVAVLLEPLAYLSASNAKIVYLFFLFSCLLATVAINSRMILGKTTMNFGLLSGYLCFAPLLSSIVGAQNTVVSLFFLSASTYCLERRDKYFDLLAGVFVGLWLFKPHMAGIVVIALILARRFTAFLSATFIFFAYICLANFSVGENWINQWLEMSRFFFDLDTLNNQHQMISLYGFGKAIESALNFDLGSEFILQSIGLGMLAHCFIQIAKSRDLNKEKMMILSTLILLVSAHTLYYELGLLLLAFTAIGKIEKAKSLLWLVVTLLFIATLVALKDSLPIQPLALMPLMTYFYLTICEQRLGSQNANQ